MARKKNEDRDFYHEIVTATEAAMFLKMPQRTFVRKVNEGILPKNAAGEYMLGEIVEAHYKKAATTESLTAANIRLVTAKAVKAELELEEYKGNLVQVSEVKRQFAENIMNAKSKFLAIPKKLALELVGQDANVIEAKLKQEIYSALKELGNETN
ncbi:MAG: hypothetical protein IJP69_03445 [Synergistaceae bacterium]|nr:hypothetical protein [Synergistaceae bacterium]MBR0253336.1 hypothetical protein [Synergistaceae bacterium]